jgi:hypothetical protein
MKDFKKMPKMACGGSVGKYEEGGEVSYDRFNAPELKTGQKLGESAFEKAESKYRQDRGMTKSSVESTRFGQKAYEEAQNKAIRESTKGIQSKKRGGKVKKK